MNSIKKVKILKNNIGNKRKKAIGKKRENVKKAKNRKVLPLTSMSKVFLMKKFKLALNSDEKQITGAQLNRLGHLLKLKNMGKLKVSDKVKAIEQYMNSTAAEIKIRGDKMGIIRKPRQPMKSYIPQILYEENKRFYSVKYKLVYLQHEETGLRSRTHEPAMAIFPLGKMKNEVNEYILMDTISWFDSWGIFGRFHENTVNNIEANIDLLENPENAYPLTFVKLSLWMDDVKQRVRGSLYGMQLKNVLFDKLSLNIKSNKDVIDGVNCIYHYLKKNYANREKGNKRMLKISEKVSSWTVKTFCEFLKKYNKPFVCYDRNLRIIEEYKIKHNKWVFKFIVSNEHIYPLEKGELSALRETFKMSKFETTEIKYIENINDYQTEYIKNNQIIKFNVSVNIKNDNNNIINNDYFDTQKSTQVTYNIKKFIGLENNELKIYTNDNNLIDDYNYLKKVFDYCPLTINFCPTLPLIYLATKNKLHSTFINDFERPTPILYNNPSIMGNLQTIDKNKCYSFILMNLVKLPIIDITCEIKEWKDYRDKHRPIIPTSFYFVKKLKKNYFNAFRNGWVTGVLVIIMIKYNCVDREDITHHRVPKMVDNCYTKPIKKMLEVDPKRGKFIINKFIGMMSSDSNSTRTYYKNLSNTYDEVDQLRGEDNYIIKLDNGYYAEECIYDNQLMNNTNMLPINISIIDNAIFFLLEKVEFLKSLDRKCTIRCIKTDSICFSSEKINVEKLKFISKTNIKKWKIEDKTNEDIKNMIEVYGENLKIKLLENDFKTVKKYIKPTKLMNYTNMMSNNTIIMITINNTIHGINKSITTYYKYNKNEYFVKVHQFKKVMMFYDPRFIKDTVCKDITNVRKNVKKNLLNKSVMFNCYAGSGKSYFSIHSLIPMLEKQHQSYIVLGNKYTTLKEYFKYKKLAKVFQYFTCNKHNQKVVSEFQEYQNIIIDESGLLSESELTYIYTNIKVNQRVYMLGDDKQLLPIGWDNKIDSPLNLLAVKQLFHFVVRMEDNFRNNYSRCEYDRMRLKPKTYVLDHNARLLINRVSKRNICIKRSYMDQMNQKYTEGWTDKFCNMKVKINERLISEFKQSRQNISKKLIKRGIFNGSYYDIVKYDENIIILKDEINNNYELTKEDFKDMFNYAHCITLYRAQGESINYDEYGIHQFDIIKNNGRMLYTALSRTLEERIDGEHYDESYEEDDSDDNDYL